MFKVFGVLLVLALAGGIGAFQFGFSDEASPSAPVAENSIYEFTMTDIDGKDVKLDRYKGNVLLVVNTASQCGFTPQYEGLQRIYDKYREQGFYVLGFPANNFRGQEPGSNEEIKEFCTTKFKVTFPMFAKISVKGDDQHPLYKYLTNPQTNPATGGEISWNFNKFLIDRTGKVVARFGSKDTPESEAVIQAIEKELRTAATTAKK